MPHARRLVLNQLLELVANLTTSAGNVFEDRTVALQAERIPALVVEPVGETSGPLGDEEGRSISHPHSWTEARVLSVALTGIATSRAEADEIALEAETAIAAATTLGKVRRVTGTTFDANGEAGGRLYDAQVTVEITYDVVNTDPGTLV